MPRLIEMVGKKFNKLLVLRDSGLRGARDRIKYVCLCDCGNESIVFGEPLRSGHTKSCGCDKSIKMTKHGMYGTPTYRSWDKIIQRCNNPNNDAYKYYGGRGIGVCDEWLDFSNFFKDMGERPKGTTIERLDSNGWYRKDNCKWATVHEQLNNTSRNIVVSIDSKLLTVKELSALSGRTYNNVNNILWRHAGRINNCYIVDSDLKNRFFKEV